MKKSNTNFWQFIEMRTALLEEEGRWGTAASYRKATKSFKGFYGTKVLRLKDINSALIEDYNRYLYEKGLIRNSVSLYNRVLRAVYNEAVNEELILDCRPFRRVYTGIDNTNKRAIPEKDLARLASSPTKDRLEMTRDLFFFSYATCGMTFVDMAYLKKTDISEDTIIYYRRKTGSRIQVKLEPEARKIIEKYAPQTVGNPYVFPIIGNRTGKEAYKRFSSALTVYNRSLKKLSVSAGTGTNISSYVPRHSWATAARNNGADISTVSEALGHQSEKTTRIYLGSFDHSKIEKVNKKLLGHLNAPRGAGVGDKYGRKQSVGNL